MNAKSNAAARNQRRVANKAPRGARRDTHAKPCGTVRPEVGALALAWPFGLLLLVLGVVALASPKHDKTLEWRQFILAGMLFPALLGWAVAWLRRRGGLAGSSSTSAAVWAPWPLALLAAAGCGLLVAGPLAWQLATVGVALVALLAARLPHRGRAIFERLGLSIVGVVLFSRMIVCWQDVPTFFAPRGAMLTGFAITALLVLGWWGRGEPATARVALGLRRCVDVAAVVLFAALAQRNWPIDVHHWAFYVEPAETVRQGGQVLWDTPAQYGALLAWLMAHMPSPSVWQNLASLIMVFDVAYACVVYAVLASLRPSWLWRVAAAVVASGAVFFVAGNAGAMLGPQEYPSVSGLRFLWPVALAYVAHLAWQQAEARPLGRLAALGTGLWIVGCLWGFDSAIWCSCVWGLAAMALALRHFSDRTPWVAWGGTVAVHGLVAVVVLGAFAGLYTAAYGHLPDAYAYVEHALAYQGGFLPGLITYNGSVWSLLTVFVVACVWLSQQISGRQVSASLVAAAALVWSVSSYYVGKSSDTTAANLVPALLVATGLCLAHVSRPSREGTARPAVAQIFSPTACLLLPLLLCTALLAFTNVPHIIAHSPFTTDGDRVLGESGPRRGDQGLIQLLAGAKLRCDDPITYVGPAVPGLAPLLPCMPRDAAQPVLYAHPRPFVPTTPVGQMNMLAPERQRLFLQRFWQRTQPTRGWLFYDIARDGSSDGNRWVEALVLEKFVEHRRFEAGAWRAVLYVPK